MNDVRAKDDDIALLQRKRKPLPAALLNGARQLYLLHSVPPRLTGGHIVLGRRRRHLRAQQIDELRMLRQHFSLQDFRDRLVASRYKIDRPGVRMDVLESAPDAYFGPVRADFDIQRVGVIGSAAMIK